MGKYDELKKLAEAAAGNWEDSLLHEYSECELYIENASPAVVLALIADNEALRNDHDKQWRLAQSGIHNTEAVLAENAKLRAENDRLRQIISDSATACGAAMSPECTAEFMGHLPEEIAGVLRQLRAELERVRADAERYRGVRRVANTQGYTDAQFDAQTDERIARFGAEMGKGADE